MTHPGQLLKQAKLFAGKELGQNFLSDKGTAERIIKKTGITAASRVLEIGPGLGALTIPIAQATKDITVIEKDSRLIPILDEELKTQGIDWVKIIRQDFLRTDIPSLAKDKKLVVIGNLPYNISSQILFRLVEQKSCIEKAFLMFQKELAARITASPGGRDFSRLSVVAQYAAEVSLLTQVGPAGFFPRPEVDSTVLEFNFNRYSELTPDQEKRLFSVVKAAFSKRRKSLKNALTGGELGFDKSFVIHVLKSAGIDDKRRAETLSVEEFKTLSQTILESS